MGRTSAVWRGCKVLHRWTGLPRVPPDSEVHGCSQATSKTRTQKQSRAGYAQESCGSCDYIYPQNASSTARYLLAAHVMAEVRTGIHSAIVKVITKLITLYHVRQIPVGGSHES